MPDDNALTPDIYTENIPKLRSGISWDSIFNPKGEVTPMGAAALAHHISTEPELPMSPENPVDYMQKRRQMEALAPQSTSPQNPLMQQYQQEELNPPQHSQFHESIPRHLLDFAEGKGIDSQEPYHRAMQDYAMRTGGMQNILSQESAQSSAQSEQKLKEAQAERQINLSKMWQPTTKEDELDKLKIQHPNDVRRQGTIPQQIASMKMRLNEPSLEPEERQLIENNVKALDETWKNTQKKGKTVIEQLQAKYPQYVSQFPPPKDDEINDTSVAEWGKKINDFAQSDLLRQAEARGISFKQNTPEPIYDPENPMKQVGWVTPKGQKFKMPGTTDEEFDKATSAGSTIKPGAITSDAARQGQVIQIAGDNLIQSINDHRNDVGNIKAIIESAFLGTPSANPQQAFVATSLKSFAALQPRLHGLRGHDAMEEFVKSIGGIPKDPDALIQSIKSVQQTGRATNFQRDTPKSDNSQNTGKTATRQEVAAYAKAKGISSLKATQILKKGGYTIGQ